MKNLMVILLISVFPFIESFNISPMKNIEGAYVFQHQNGEDWLMLKDNYFTYTSFNKGSKQFHYSRGGTYQADGQDINWKLEFDTEDPAKVGKTETSTLQVRDQSILVGDKEYTRSDDGSGELAGYYRISGRMQDKQVNEMPL